MEYNLEVMEDDLELMEDDLEVMEDDQKLMETDLWWSLTSGPFTNIQCWKMAWE